MSVESEILRIQHNIADAYAAVSEKGGEVPLQPTSANLAAAVRSITSSGELIAGDGLSKEGDTLSVDNPVRGILTQAEFNALTKEQKASGTYFVDDGMTCAGECGDVYSTEERRIGTWIDGKPIYSKTFSGVTQKNTNAVVGFADISDLSIDTVVEINGVVNSDLDTGIVGLSCTRSDASLQLVGVSTDKKKLNVFVQSDSFTSKPFHCTLKYTKTTDQEVSA